MGAVGETAVFGKMENFFEITCQFLRFHIEGTETFDAWGIDEPPPTPQRNHLRESGGMLAGIMSIRNLCSSEVSVRYKTVDESRLPYPTIAAEHRDFVFKQRTEVVDALPRLGRHLTALIAYGLIEIDHRLLIALFIIIEQVGLIEDKHYRHSIGLSRSQETVYERGAGLRVCHRNHQEGLVHIRCNDMALLGEVDAFADDIVTAIVDGSDERTATRPSWGTDSDPVAYGHRVGRANAL